MVTFMSTIPRRKIYETMLIFEDGMLEMNIMLYNEKNFDKYFDKFNNCGYIKIKSSYKEIKALFVLFLDNKKFNSDDEFKNELNYFIENIVDTDKKLLKNKNIPKEFKIIIDKMNFNIEKNEKILNFQIGKKLYELFNDFNHQIPKILEIRRDFMK